MNDNCWLSIVEWDSFCAEMITLLSFDVFYRFLMKLFSKVIEVQFSEDQLHWRKWPLF